MLNRDKTMNRRNWHNKSTRVIRDTANMNRQNHATSYRSKEEGGLKETWWTGETRKTVMGVETKETKERLRERDMKVQ